MINLDTVSYTHLGGTYDIGLQSLSGAMERGHDLVYVCYDNGAYTVSYTHLILFVLSFISSRYYRLCFYS